MRARRSILACGLVAAVALLLGCTSGRPAASASQSASPASPASSVPASTVAMYTVPERLGCRDAATAISPAPQNTRWVNGLWTEAFDGALLTNLTPAGKPMFWKTFLYVGPDAAPWTTVRVVSPAVARLFFTPFDVWEPPRGTSKPAYDPTDVTAGRRSMAFEACLRQPAGYTGGVTTVGRACLILSVEAAGRAPRQVRLALGVPCET
jgi:hypothetical protein